MPDPQERLHSPAEFAAVIRRLYPTLDQATPDDNKLTAAILAVHPEFRAHVMDPLGGMAEAPKPPALPNYGAHPAAPPSPLIFDDSTPEGQDRAYRQPSRAADLIGAPARAVVKGLKGVSTLSRAMPGAVSREAPPSWPDVAQAGADVIGGGMAAGSAFMPSLLVEAPWQMVTGIAGGTAVSAATEKGLETFAPGLDPKYQNFASAVAGLVGGVAAGEGGGNYFKELAGRPGKARAGAQIAAEDQAFVWDQERERNLSEQQMRSEFAAGNAAADDRDSLNNLLGWQRQTLEDQKFRTLQEGIAENDRLNQIAQRMKTEQTTHGSPFETVEAFANRPPLALPPVQEPAGLLEAGSPAGILAGASDQVYPGPTDLNPNTVDVIGVGDQRPIATSEAPPPPLIQTLGEQLSSELENKPPSALEPRPSEATRVKMTERQDFKSRSRRVISDAVSEMEDMPHQRGASFSDQEGLSYSPPIAGSDWYWRVVGKDASNPPSRAVITELMRAFKDSDGTLKGAELPQEIVDAGQKAVDLKTEGGFRRAYARWAPEIARAVKNRTTAMLGYERVARERSQGAGETRSSEVTPSAAQVEVPANGEKAGPPPPVDAGGAVDDLPDFLQNLSREGVPGAHDEETLPLPGMEAGAENAPPKPIADLPQQSLDLTPTSPPEPKQWTIKDFFEHMKGEEGVLILNVGPNNKRGLRDWLEKHAAEYGQDEWHEKATTALEAGEPDVAWRIAAMASARAMAASGVRGSEERGTKPHMSMSPEEIAEFKQSPRYKRQFAQLKKDLGGEVPKGIDLNEEGVMTFGKPEHNLKAAATDLLLGKNFAADVIAAANPSKIIRIEGNRDPELRINRQIAEQLVRSMPDDLVEPLMELLKIDDRAEFAKHFARTVSSWGKGLRMLKDWQDENWNEIVHISNPRPEGIGMGAAHLDEIRTPGGFVKWLKDSSIEDREDVNFTLPKNVKEGTKEADQFAKSWFRQREARTARRVALAKTIGDLAVDGSAFDKALISGALEAPGSKSRGTLDAVENTSRAFVISQPVTLIRNLWTQAGRYGIGMLDDVLASAYSMATLNPKEATRYITRAGETLKGMGREGNVSAKMLKTPWIDSLESTYDFTADSVVGLSSEDMRKSIALLDQFPRRAATYAGGLTLENAGGDVIRPSSKIPGIHQLIQPEVRNFVTVLGRTQEMAFRGSVFDSSFRAGLRDLGLDPTEELAGDPTKLIAKLGEKKMDQLIGGAVASALDYTFAAKPYPGSIPAMILNTFSNIPVLSPMLRMGFPFPRFNWVSAPRWIYDHSPLALMDIPMAMIGQFTHEDAAFKGRLYRGMEAQKIQNEVIPRLAHSIGQTEYQIATSQQEFVKAKVDARQAAKAFSAAEKRGESTGMLPEIHQEITDTMLQMQDRIKAAQDAKTTYDDSVVQLRELKQQQRRVEEKLLKIKEIGAPNTSEYFSRMASGGAMLTAAYLMRSSDGAKDTKWYEYNVEAPGFGKHTLDLRAFAPMVQFLLAADIMHSVHEDTDWSKRDQYFKDSGQSKADLAAWEDFMVHHYHGKYTGSSIGKEALTAFLSISPAAGAGAGIIDYLTGRTGTVKEGIVQGTLSAILSTVGQFIGRFTTPIRPLKDLAGQFSEEEAKARIPQESSDQTHHAEELYGPALANIPFASRLIPEKKSPITGEAISTTNPVARAFAGLSEHDRNRYETEIAHTGIEYSQMVPRQTGDRGFDNAVAEAYHKGLVEYANDFLDDPDYQAMPPELRRDRLKGAFGFLKRQALYEAGEKLGLTAEQTHDKIESKGSKQLRDRKQLMVDLLDEIDKEHGAPPPDDGEVKPQAASGGPGHNAPPAALFDAQGGRQGIHGGFDASPPAAL